MLQAVAVEKCTEMGCNDPKVASINDRGRCCSHFISYCYAKIDQSETCISRKEHWDAAISHQTHEALSDIADAAAAVGLGCYELTDIERAQIVHILSHVEMLIGHFRRFPRKRLQISVSMQVQPTGTVELVTTIDVSIQGASLAHRCSLNKGDLLVLRSPKSGYSSQARVVWTRPSRDTYVSGVELTDGGNWWEPQLLE